MRVPNGSRTDPLRCLIAANAQPTEEADASARPEAAQRQGLAELITVEKNRCIPELGIRVAIDILPATVLGAGRDNIRDNRGDNRRRVSRTVSYT